MWRLAKPIMVSSFLTVFFNCLTMNSLAANMIWSSSADLSLVKGNAIGSQVVLDSTGRATAIWSRFNGANYIVQNASSPFNGQWSKPNNLSQSGQNAFFVKLAIDLNQNAIALWSRFNGTNFIIQSDYRHSQNGWGKPEDISFSGAAKYDAVKSQIVFDSNGNATAIWQRYNGVNNIIQSAKKTAGGNWSQPINLTISNPVGTGDIDPQLAVDRNGNILAIWANTSIGKIEFSICPYNGQWSLPIPVSNSGQTVLNPQIGVDGYGNAIAVWTIDNGGDFIVQSSSRLANQQWDTPVNISIPGEGGLTPSLSVDLLGNAVAIWQGSDGVNTLIQGATKSQGSSWNPVFTLSDLGQDASEPQVKITPTTQDIVAVWKRSNGANFIIQAIKGKLQAPWSNAVSLSLSGQDAISPQVVIDNSGRAVAIWQRSNGSNTIIQSSFGINIP